MGVHPTLRTKKERGGRKPWAEGEGDWEVGGWVGGWVGLWEGRGERGGDSNELLWARDWMGGWVGGWVGGLSYLYLPGAFFSTLPNHTLPPCTRAFLLG